MIACVPTFATKNKTQTKRQNMKATTDNKAVKIERLGGEPWNLFISDTENVPEGSNEWFRPSQALNGTRSINRLIAYVKRYGKHNGGTATWHIIPFTSAKDGSRLYSLYISWK